MPFSWSSNSKLLLNKWKTEPKLFQSWQMKLDDLVGSVKSQFNTEPKLAPFLNIGESILFRDLISKALLHYPKRIERLIDFGCGSSLPTITAILGIAETNRPTQVLAFDVNKEAISASQHNIVASGLASTYQIKNADMLTVLTDTATIRSANIIVANPPYVPAPAVDSSGFLVPVNGGVDGLRFLRPLLQMPIKSGTLVAIIASSLSSPGLLSDLIDESFNVLSCDSHIVPFGPYLKSEQINSHVMSLLQEGKVDCFQLHDGQYAFITYALLLEKK